MIERKKRRKWDAKEKRKRKEISTIQPNPFSGEDSGMEGELEGQTDGEATKKGGRREEKGYPFSHQMSKRGVAGSER